MSFESGNVYQVNLPQKTSFNKTHGSRQGLTSKITTFRLRFVLFLALVISYIFRMPIFSGDTALLETTKNNLFETSIVANENASQEESPENSGTEAGEVVGESSEHSAKWEDGAHISRDFKLDDVDDYVDKSDSSIGDVPWSDNIIKHEIGLNPTNDSELTGLLRPEDMPHNQNSGEIQFEEVSMRHRNVSNETPTGMVYGLLEDSVYHTDVWGEYLVQVSQSSQGDYTEYHGPPEEIANLGKGWVILDAGHGGSDPGTSHRKGEHKPGLGGSTLLEKDITLEIVTKTAAILDESGVDYVLTRNNDSSVPLSDRVTLANSIPAAFCVSVHCDWYGDNTVHGMSTLYALRKGSSLFEVGSASGDLAKTIHSSLSSGLDTTNRGTNINENIIILRETRIPAVLIELGFLSNADDADLLCDEGFKDKVAENLARGIIDSLESANPHTIM